MKDVITIRGNRVLWIIFVNKIRKERKEVWTVLEPMIKEYLGGKKWKKNGIRRKF